MCSGHKSLIRHVIGRYFLPFFGLSLTFLVVSFEAQNFLILMESSLSIFGRGGCTFGVVSRKPLLNPRPWRFTPLFCSKSFILLAHTFRTAPGPHLTALSDRSGCKVYPCCSVYLFFFCGWIILYFVDITHFVYPFISSWTFWSFLLFGYD